MGFGVFVFFFNKTARKTGYLHVKEEGEEEEGRSDNYYDTQNTSNRRKINWAIKFENLPIKGVMIHWANLRWKITAETNVWI